MYLLKIHNKYYVVPYVIDNKRKVKYLKTIYPSNKIQTKYEK